ncbi:MAG: ER-golgi trafficking TRAPP I complex 85 kDa subunit-domain-containing protein [Piptocephalis tieghemiana]|nr:MAG: ER-golgi trafficking TRAPP I complex 85 kDa subunit-domain-containing protein [Piptocephalis tieghemiana]
MFDYTGAVDYESFDHPVAFVLGVSTAHPDPIAELTRLMDTCRQAPIFQRGFLDPEVPKYFILLHDSASSDYSASLSLFEKMKRQMNGNCHLLRINSRPEEDTSPFIEDLWRPYMVREAMLESVPREEILGSTAEGGLDGFGGGGGGTSADRPVVGDPSGGKDEDHQVDETKRCGELLSPEDVQGIRVMCKELLTQTIIPFMEQNCQIWNEQIASGRRGLTGRLFSASRRLLGQSSSSSSSGGKHKRRGSEETRSTVQDGPFYSYGTPEAQLRRLADYSFMLGDYRFAQSIYETLRRDFATERAWKYQAAVQSMFTLCALILMPLGGSGAKMDVVGAIEYSYHSLVHKGNLPVAAARMAMLHYEALQDREMWVEAADALMRLGGEKVDLRCGLLYEQAAHGYLRACEHHGHPRIRKNAFALVLAGFRLGRAGQGEHSQRCYLAAARILRDRGWTIMENHVDFALGHQTFLLHRYAEALEHFTRLLGESEQSAALQGLYLGEFLEIYKEVDREDGEEGKDEAKDKWSRMALPLPKIKDDTITVVPLLEEEEEDEDEVEEVKPVSKNRKKHGQFKSRPNADGGGGNGGGRPVCAVGEWVSVDLEWSNPLHIPIELSQVEMECVHDATDPSKGPSTSGDEAEVVDLDAEGGSKIRKRLYPDSILRRYEHYDAEQLGSITLEGKEERRVSFRLRPTTPGSIRILGIRYVVCGVVPGHKKFWKRGPRLNGTKAERTMQLYGPDRSLDLAVTPPMPLLRVEMHHPSSSLLSGEVSPGKMCLMNAGERALKDLYVSVSHPTMLRLGGNSMLPAYLCPPSTDSSDVMVKEPELEDNAMDEPGLEGVAVLKVPLGLEGILRPGESLTLPLWVRGERIGRHELRLLFSYTASGEKETQKIAQTRLLRLSMDVQVLPSLRINTFIRASARGLNEFVLGIEMENLQTTADFVLEQISLTSPRWRIAPIPALENDMDEEDEEDETEQDEDEDESVR